MVKAVIFDVDGTLLDSVDLHAGAWQDIFRRYGVKAEFQKVRDQIGKGGDKLMKVFLSKDQIELEGKRIEAERAELFNGEHENITLCFLSAHIVYRTGDRGRRWR